jgi:transcriptional regulator with XRE-family HTH domain
MGKLNRKPSSELRMRVSTNLRALRQARGYTQRELGKLCGFTHSFVSNIEQGRQNISLATLEAFSQGLGCTEADLLLRRRGQDGWVAGYSSEKSSFWG